MNAEGNHGEDVKEDDFLYGQYPVARLQHETASRLERHFRTHDSVSRRIKTHLGRTEDELIDTGIFDDDRDFDVFVEYAKELPEDIWSHYAGVGPEEAVLTAPADAPESGTARRGSRRAPGDCS